MYTYDDHSEPNVNEIYDLLIGHWKTGVLKAAIKLDVFSKIAAEENTVEALAIACSISQRWREIWE